MAKAAASTVTSSRPIPLVDLQAEYREIQSEVATAMDRVLARGDYILGEDVDQFEQEFAAWCGAAACVGVATGTDALHLALRACGVGPGDEVITAPNSFVASASAITMAGATPVFADIDPSTYTLDPQAVERAISSRTRALVPVHLYGQMADMPALLDIARKHDLQVIEDACQAHGASLNGRRAGTWGDAGCFSFYPAKNLGCYGDGGAVVTDDPEVALKIRMLRNYGQARKYHHDCLAYNSRLDSLQAAVLRVKLRHLDRWNNMRRAAASRYDRLLTRLGFSPPAVRRNAEHVYHLYVLEVEDRERVVAAMHQSAVMVGVHYPIPIHLQRAYGNLNLAHGSFPAAEKACEHCLSLPLHPFTMESEQERVAELLEQLEVSPARPWSSSSNYEATSTPEPALLAGSAAS